MDTLIIAQAVGNVNFDVEGVGLEEPIVIPFFNQIALPNDPYFSALSWLSFIGLLVSIGLIIFWIALIIRAAFQALQSEGNEEGMAESFNKLKSVFIGAGISIAVPIILSLIGGIMGLGPLWNWPAAFRGCPNTDRSFFFQEVIYQSGNNIQDPVKAAENACY